MSKILRILAILLVITSLITTVLLFLLYRYMLLIGG